MDHSKKFFSFLFFTLLIHSTRSQENTQPIQTDPSYYYNLCAPSTCNNRTLPYPFTLPTPCHPSPLETVCPNNQSFYLTSPRTSLKFRILSIDFSNPLITTIVGAAEGLFTCGAQVSQEMYESDATVFSLPANFTFGTHLNCTSPIPANSVRGLQNASCIGCKGQDPSNVCYYAPGFVSAPNCERFHIFTPGNFFNASSVDNLRAYLQLGYTILYTKPRECRECEASGGRCGANPLSGSFVCFCPSSVHSANCTDGMVQDISTWINPPGKGGSGHSKLVIIAISVSALLGIVGVLVSIVVVIFVHKRKRYSHTHDTIISNISPTRYSYSQLKRFTNNFSSRIGEGGFGTVYRGSIHQNGSELPIAVKVLKISGQTEEQFMNEVRTIGSIHHHNLVSMLGYCVERETHALVYEFLENGSLDKYIYNARNEVDRDDYGSKTHYKQLTYKDLYDIALQTARGILYLHNDCSEKILHCDIKPPNVLLDSDFTAKVADFGLAKIIDKGHSHVSLTFAQGTPGYTAPEMWSKTSRPVTEKTDVYSYGMLLLEMAGRRKNYNGEASNTSQAYFPEWIYNKITTTESTLLMNIPDSDESFDIVQTEDGKDNQVEKLVDRMCLVGLWCIQYYPSKRPSMDKVVQMLEGRAEIQVPPYPFPEYTLTDHARAKNDDFV
ncbi:non-specific serine/threonine protein kinase [Ranunculus cassubicifolius]